MKKQFVFIVIVCILLLLPVALFLVSAKQYQSLPPLELLLSKFKPKIAAQYSVKSTVPGATLTLVNTQYLDYLAANLKLFSSQAIVDPLVYYGKPDSTKKYTVSHMRLELVPTLERYLVGVSGEKGFAAFGTYAVEDEALVVRISVDLNESGNPQAGPLNQREDVFLRAALLTLYYAHGRSYGIVDPVAFRKIQEEIKTYIYDGLFAWPIRIKQL